MEKFSYTTTIRTFAQTTKYDPTHVILRISEGASKKELMRINDAALIQRTPGVRDPILHILSNSGTKRQKWYVGKLKENDIILRGTDIEDSHAQVLRIGHLYFVKDLGTKSGTTVHGQRLPPSQEIALKPGAPIQFGTTELYEFLDYDALNKLIKRTARYAKLRIEANAKDGYLVREGPVHEQKPIELRGDDKPAQVWTIGRKKDNDITIPHQTISSHHAQIVRRDKDFFFQDLGSTNGSRINGRKALPNTPISLGRKASIQLGADKPLYFYAGELYTQIVEG